MQKVIIQKLRDIKVQTSNFWFHGSPKTFRFCMWDDSNPDVLVPVSVNIGGTSSVEKAPEAG